MKLLFYRFGKHKKTRNNTKSGKKSLASEGLGISSFLKSDNKNTYKERTRTDDKFKMNYGGIARRSTYVQKQKLSFERFMFFTFIIAFTLLIVVQAALMNPTVRTFINGTDEAEGTPLGVEEYLYEEGEIGLKLLNGNADGSLKVLVNGDEMAVFKNNIVNLQVKDGDIIEIDASEAKTESEVVIISKSDNINSDSANKRVRLKSGVKKLTQVRIE